MQLNICMSHDQVEADSSAYNNKNKGNDEVEEIRGITSSQSKGTFIKKQFSITVITVVCFISCFVENKFDYSVNIGMRIRRV